MIKTFDHTTDALRVLVRFKKDGDEGYKPVEAWCGDYKLPERLRSGLSMPLRRDQMYSTEIPLDKVLSLFVAGKLRTRKDVRPLFWKTGDDSGKLVALYPAAGEYIADLLIAEEAN